MHLQTSTLALMRSINDIKILLFAGYALGYVLSVFAPIVIDPLLTSHTLFGSRTYPYAFLCLPIYVLLLAVTSVILVRGTTPRSMYISVIVFLAAILITFPIFLPEFPHGNIFGVGMTTTFLSAFSIFVWSISNQIVVDDKMVKSGGANTLEYAKTLFTFTRQGSFAGVALFGALFFASYTNGLKFNEAIATEKSNIFLLNSNVNAQVAFYTIYSVVGPVRYFFVASMKVLAQLREITKRLDRKAANDDRKRRES
jgi:hypothetical protein